VIASRTDWGDAVTGLPLPFVSCGGSSMFACWLSPGLVDNVHLCGLYERRVR
jgi:rod shape determining protein RodA